MVERDNESLVEVLILLAKGAYSTEGWTLESARAAVLARMVPQWQDIASAPKDGTEILIYESGHRHGWDYAIGRYRQAYGGYWSNRNSVGSSNHPTHWMPLPSCPTDLK